MASASTIRLQIEAALAHRIPSALTPAPKLIRPAAATGIGTLDETLQGGLPVGAISELVGAECSGRTSIALSFVAQMTCASKVCAWVDVSDAFDPISAAAAGIDLARLLWVRCGAIEKPAPRRSYRFALPEKYLVPAPPTRGLHGGGFGPHPRTEAQGMSKAIGNWMAPRCAEPQRRARPERKIFKSHCEVSLEKAAHPSRRAKPWSRLEQALRVTDLLLQGGGFSAVVLDMGDLAAEFVSRIPLATWFRYRAAAERTQASILLLTQHACAKSSAELQLQLAPAEPLPDEQTVFTGTRCSAEVVRWRFTNSGENVFPMRKPPQKAKTASWQSRTAWTGQR